MVLRAMLTALSEAPGRTMDIGNVAMSAMLGQGGGWVEMQMSSRPGIAGDGVGEPDVTCVTAGVGVNPPLGSPRTSASGRCSKVGAWGNNKALVGPSGEPFEVGDSGSGDGTCWATTVHLTRGVSIGKASAGSNRAAVAMAGEDSSQSTGIGLADNCISKAAACNSGIRGTPPPGKLKAFLSGVGIQPSGAGGGHSNGAWVCSGKRVMD